jgi:GNAT superfamily N-acetyltransferase
MGRGGSNSLPEGKDHAPVNIAVSSACADAALVRRIEGGWAWAAEASARAFGATRPGAGVAVERLGGGAATFFGPGSPLSQAQGLGLDGPVSEDDLDRLDAFFASKDATASIEVSSLADPGLLPALSKRGYHVAEQTHMLILPFGGAAEAPAVRNGPLTVSRVAESDARAHAACAWAVMRGFFDGPGEPPAEMAEVMSAMNAAPGTSTWLARVGDGADAVPVETEGDAAGGAFLMVHDGLALFAGDATVPAQRRQGVQSALIAARLAEAVQIGCVLAVACTNPGSISQRNYERQGFRLVYARTLMNRPQPGAPARVLAT